MAGPTTKVTLMFAHGAGFCKGTWDPITRRLKSSRLLQSAPTDFHTFDFPYHGAKQDPTALQYIKADLSNPKRPRVWNEKHDLVEWAAGAVKEQVDAWKEKTRNDFPNNKTQHKLIGVGHSMGSAGLWATEVAHPGTFDGLILFEPVLAQHSPETDHLLDYMTAVTLRRRTSWPSRAAAEEYFDNLRNFAKLDREVLAAYVRGGLTEADDGTVTLACHPHIEASIFCQKPLWLTEHELRQPKCRTTFHWGTRSKVWFHDRFQTLQRELPDIYTVREPMEGSSHVLVLEDPALASEKIALDLAELEPYAAATN
uniref:AB hydrolase-1 domain-containing protein n=1 Tax=Hyaloperonospora arabidopsidis (strain Emoy2) TaxID=559515 RepID=M4C6D6_HYAAE